MYFCLVIDILGFGVIFRVGLIIIEVIYISRVNEVKVVVKLIYIWLNWYYKYLIKKFILVDYFLGEK